MRTITYNAGAYLVEELQRSGVVRRFLHDGGDILLFETWQAQTVSIHLIESPIELYEVRSILAGNEARGHYTLFIVWADRLLPSDGQRYDCPDWMQAITSLYGDRIYAYDIFGSEIFVFPVYFHGEGRWRDIRCGVTVNMGHLGCDRVESPIRGFSGAWRVAHFGTSAKHTPRDPAADARWARLHPYFAVLGIDADDDRETIKKAYRLLARRYHPDLNASREATARMQAINIAYEQILKALDHEA